ncbi:MAG: hypothetical protein K0B07_03785 [DPANN group archaeon]|nr:hypothetical protein [DPANN group archaeon]
MYEKITQAEYRQYLSANIASGRDTLIKPVEALLKLLKSERTYENDLELVTIFHPESSLSDLFDSVELSIINLLDDKPYMEEDHTYFLNDKGIPSRVTHEDYANLIESYNLMVKNMCIPYNMGDSPDTDFNAVVIESNSPKVPKVNSTKAELGIPMYV